MLNALINKNYFVSTDINGYQSALKHAEIQTQLRFPIKNLPNLDNLQHH